MSKPTLLWLRRDLRLRDQAALLAAVEEGPVIPVYILDDHGPKYRIMGAASRWWLHHSLAALDAALRARGSRLILRRGKAADVLAALADESGAGRVHAIAHYEPWWRNAERDVAKRLDLVCHDGNYLLPPATVKTGSGGPYKIFTPFSRAVVEHMPPPAPRPAPAHMSAPDHWPKSETLDECSLLPTKPDWATGMAEEWTPGEEGAHERLDDFVDKASDYDEARNLPSQEGSSRLSPHLHFGEISPAAVWHALRGRSAGVTTFRTEIIWRDYAQNIILTYPDYGKANGKAAFDTLPWRSTSEARADISAWKKGLTGYPIVDAGMRQLWTSGWMHNRVRMIAASFLIKHLLVDWRVGEAWFWDTLVDADYGNNSVNWQWVAGSGVDANMFGRIMAPLVQSPKFDAGDYIRQWVPELAHIQGDAVHDPDAHGCRPADYPAKIIGHREARERALAAYRHVKG
ncbi:cryptochrome/photolyase family protein [Sphingobium subterraneum]|uniref:Deoxyribodipyrimidine photo-lyase n=1 Tax=Sphingobium subterraneum TaxID=627688 RepID=A0A841J382_9SPHN|nr:deoxyribodipyrimidine photo-lyase [Sphingobium subterraneum]MBB6124802.1 deoxyribodipyrimidine photo-lyase [Sphingobium subterraneum]